MLFIPKNTIPGLRTSSRVWSSRVCFVSWVRTRWSECPFWPSYRCFLVFKIQGKHICNTRKIRLLVVWALLLTAWFYESGSFLYAQTMSMLLTPTWITSHILRHNDEKGDDSSWDNENHWHAHHCREQNYSYTTTRSYFSSPEESLMHGNSRPRNSFNVHRINRYDICESLLTSDTWTPVYKKLCVSIHLFRGCCFREHSPEEPSLMVTLSPKTWAHQHSCK